jgi:hypothetical protein
MSGFEAVGLPPTDPPAEQCVSEAQADWAVEMSEDEVE